MTCKDIKSQHGNLPTSQKKRGCRGQQTLYRKDVPPTNDVTPTCGVHSANNLRLTNDVLYAEVTYPQFTELSTGPSIFDDGNNRCTCMTSEVDTQYNENVHYRNRHNTFGQFDRLLDFILYSDGYTE